MDPDNPGQVIGHTEVKRREVYMKKLEVQFSESHPVLVQLVSRSVVESRTKIKLSKSNSHHRDDSVASVRVLHPQ